MITWSKGDPKYNKMVPDDKIIKNMSKSGIFNHKRKVILQYEGSIDAGGYISQTENDNFLDNNPTLIWQVLNSISK